MDGPRPGLLARALPFLGAALLAPLVAAVGFTWWNAPAGIEQGLLLGLLSYLSELVEGTPLPPAPYLAVPAVLAVGAVIYALQRLQARLPGPLGLLVSAIEAALSALGLLASVGVVAVGVAVDRPVFWGGLVIALLLGFRLTEPPQADARQPVGRRREPPAAEAPLPVRRSAGALYSAAAVALAGLTLLEGPGFHSPAFRVGELWATGPGRNAWLAGGLWLVIGLALAAALFRILRTRRRGSPSRARRFGAAAMVLVVLAASTLGDPTHLVIARILSGLGILAVAAAAAPSLVTFPAFPVTVLGRLDPRRLLAAVLPLLLFTGLCAARGLIITNWTTPPELPAGIEQLSTRSGIFAVATSEDGKAVYYTDRSTTTLGVLRQDERDTTWALHSAGADAVEELGGPIDGTLWVSVGRWDPSPQMGLMPVALDGGPGEYVQVAGCWIASWTPVPPKAAALAASVKDGDILLGCEGQSAVFVFRPSEGRTVARLPVHDDVEAAAFHSDGGSFYGISLWGAPSVSRHEWPSGDLIADAPLGPFNWAIAFDGRGSLWVSRFFEGVALVLHPEHLGVQHRVRLSFGVRAMIYEPVHDRIWASAAYSGRVWEVEAKPPFRRRVHPLCGQGRDLKADGHGRVVVATDCGIFRLDPARMEPL